MKIAVTFFGKKRRKYTYDKIFNNKKNVSIFSSHIVKLKNYEIIVMLLFGIAVIMNSKNIIYIATNI